MVIWNLEIIWDFGFGIWDFSRAVMAKIEIDIERCKGCGLCTISCPKGLIRNGDQINRQGYFYVCWDDQGSCTGCAICGEICPDVAIQVWRERGESKS